MTTNVTGPSLSSQKIIEVPNIDKAALFVKCNLAAVDMFKNAKSVIQFADKDAGVISGKFIISDVMAGIYFHRIDITLTIEVKDSKARLSCSDITATITGDALYGHYIRDNRSFPITEGSALAEKVKPEITHFEQTFADKITTKKSDW